MGKGLEAAKAVGAYLLRAFFGGSMESWREAGVGTPSVRALAEHPRLQMTANQVWNSLQLIDQLELLGHDVGGQLTMTSHRELFALKDGRAKRALAKRAATEGWTSGRVRDEVRDMTQPATGRPRDHVVEALVKKVERGSKALLDAGAMTALLAAEATPEQISAWSGRLRHRAMLLDGLAGRLERRLIDG